MEEKKSSGRGTLYDCYVHSIRKRLTDSDGASAKAAIDGIVKSGLLRDDNHHVIRKTIFSQEKAGKGQEEKTIITFKPVLES
jgi:hypothetical protein